MQRGTEKQTVLEPPLWRDGFQISHQAYQENLAGWEGVWRRDVQASDLGAEEWSQVSQVTCLGVEQEASRQGQCVQKRQTARVQSWWQEFGDLAGDQQG